MIHKKFIIHQEIINNLQFQQDFQTLNENLLTFIQPSDEIQYYLNTKHLSCPMPLLKLKILLKEYKNGWIYLTATDPNSQQDIGAFCQYLNYHCHAICQSGIYHLFIAQIK